MAFVVPLGRSNLTNGKTTKAMDAIFVNAPLMEDDEEQEVLAHMVRLYDADNLVAPPIVWMAPRIVSMDELDATPGWYDDTVFGVVAESGDGAKGRERLNLLAARVRNPRSGSTTPGAAQPIKLLLGVPYGTLTLTACKVKLMVVATDLTSGSKGSGSS